MKPNPAIKALKISEIDVNDVIIASAKKNNKVSITYKKNPLVFQTPWLEITADKLKKTSFPNIFQMDTLFKGDSKQKIHQFYQFIELLETRICEQVEKHGTKWFTQKNIILKALARESETHKGLYYIKWPIELKSNIFVDENNQPLHPSTLKEHDRVKCIVEVSNLWINTNQFGLASVVQKIMVSPPKEKIIPEYMFAKSDSLSDDNSNESVISLLATESARTSKPSQKPDSKKKHDKSKNVEVVLLNKGSDGKNQKSQHIKNQLLDLSEGDLNLSNSNHSAESSDSDKMYLGQ